MSFNSYEELIEAVEQRQSETLTLEVSLGAKYSPEYEEAKAELQQAKALRAVVGGQGFLSDSLPALEERVASLKPEARGVWIRYSRLPIREWTALMKQAGINAIDQYEKVLPKTFVGVYGADPDVADEHGVFPEPLTTDPNAVSTKSPKPVLPGGAIVDVITTFTKWQNSGGEVVIHPTKSGQD